MGKKTTVIVALFLLIGAGLGYLGNWYNYKALQAKAINIIEMQEETTNKMTRMGKVVEVDADSVTVEIEKSGESKDINKKIKYNASQYTKIQIGMEFAGKQGQKNNLREYLNPGEYVNLLVKDDQIALIQREFRSDEIQETK